MALLLSNSALAGYACPGAEKAAEVARMVEAGMDCADTMSHSMDDEHAALCHAHCQSSQKSADNVQPPALPAVMLLGSVLEVRVPAESRKTGVFLQPGLLRTSAAPPLAIRNCCFRT